MPMTQAGSLFSVLIQNWREVKVRIFRSAANGDLSGLSPFFWIAVTISLPIIQALAIHGFDDVVADELPAIEAGLLLSNSRREVCSADSQRGASGSSCPEVETVKDERALMVEAI